MYSKNKLICSALVQTLIRKKGENVATEELMKIMNFNNQSPAVSSEIKHLEKFEPLA
jgi:hypothetical protein